MIASPIKQAIKPPRVDPWKNSLLSERQKNVGNFLQFIETEARAARLAILGETVGKKVVFGSNYIRIDGAINPYTAGTVTANGTSVPANNKSAAITSVSGQYIYFAPGTWTPATELQGTLSDGTNTLQIAVSPSAQQTLTSLSNFDLVASGKNLLNPADTATSGSANATRLFDGMSLVINTTTPSTTWAYSTFKIQLKPNTMYRVSALSTRTGTTGGGIAIFNNNLSVQLGGSASALNPNTSFTTDASGLTAFAFYAKQSGTGNDSATFTNIQLELGSTATSYEPYSGTKQTINLRDTSGNALEDGGLPSAYGTDGFPTSYYYQSYVIRDTDGKFKLVQNEVKLTFNGSEAWSTDTPYDANYTRCALSLSAAANASHYGANTHFTQRTGAAGAYEYVYVNGNAVYLQILSSRLASANAAGLKTWLALNNITLRYHTASPITIELHSDNQAQLTAAAKSFDGITNITLGVAYGQIEFDQWSKEALR